MEIKFDDYVSAAEHLPEKADNTFFISPSAFYDFIDKKHLWFRQQFMKEDQFEGNTGSNLGNIIHKACEMYTQEVDVTDEQINEYIDSLPDNDEIDKQTIRDNYRSMIDTVLTRFLMDTNIDETEQFIGYDLSEHVTVGGTFDYTRTDRSGRQIIGDYKTTASKLPPKKIEQKHKMQALIYAYIMDKSDLYMRPDMLEIVYITRHHDPVISEKTGKPGKEYFPDVSVLQYEITDNDMAYIDSLMRLCAETMHFFFDNPDKAYIIFTDYRLKGEFFETYKYTEEQEQPLF
jgi:hypothetical protein